MEQEWSYDDDELIEMAELFKVFGDSTRIKILTVLLDGENACRRSRMPLARPNLP